MAGAAAAATWWCQRPESGFGCSITTSGCTCPHGWFCTSEMGMCSHQELLKQGGPPWSRDLPWLCLKPRLGGSAWGQGRSRGVFAQSLLPACLHVAPAGAAAPTGAKNARESWMCTRNPWTPGAQTFLLSSPQGVWHPCPKGRPVSPGGCAWGVSSEGAGRWVLC